MSFVPIRFEIGRPAAPWSLIGVLALLMLGLGRPAVAIEADKQTKACLRCHAMETIAYRDPVSREIVDLSIAPRLLPHSVHGELACTECHRKSYRRYPHPEEAERESFSCVGCHEDDSAEATYQLKTVESEYRQSVHVAPGAKHADRFNCHSCHDPHVFKVSRVGTDIAQVVRDGNQVCLSCHEKARDPQLGSHAWLPKRDAHWESVRCVDCHTPASAEPSRVSHQILTAEDSNRDCVACHSRDARLLNRLYQYRSEEDLARRGLFAKAIFNEAYIVGMSRSPLVDWISLLIIGLTLLVLTAHGLGRYLAYRRRRNR